MPPRHTARPARGHPITMFNLWLLKQPARQPQQKIALWGYQGADGPAQRHRPVGSRPPSGRAILLRAKFSVIERGKRDRAIVVRMLLSDEAVVQLIDGIDGWRQNYSFTSLRTHHVAHKCAQHQRVHQVAYQQRSDKTRRQELRRSFGGESSIASSLLSSKRPISSRANLCRAILAEPPILYMEVTGSIPQRHRAGVLVIGVYCSMGVGYRGTCGGKPSGASGMSPEYRDISLYSPASSRHHVPSSAIYYIVFQTSFFVFRILCLFCVLSLSQTVHGADPRTGYYSARTINILLSLYALTRTSR